MTYLLLISSVLGLLGFAGLVASMIKFGNETEETPVVKHEAVIICLVPRINVRT